jgi:hypothetical protein
MSSENKDSFTTPTKQTITKSSEPPGAPRKSKRDVKRVRSGRKSVKPMRLSF